MSSNEDVSETTTIAQDHGVAPSLLSARDSTKSPPNGSRDPLEQPKPSAPAERFQNRLQPVDLPPKTVSNIDLTDSLFIGTIGGLLCGIVLVVLARVIPGAELRPLGNLVDMGISAAISCGIIYTLSARWPVYLGLLFLICQLGSGVLVGQFMMDSLCIWSGADPSNIMMLRAFGVSILTFLTSVLPIFARPLYEAAFESSWLRNTPAYCFLRSHIGDRLGNRLTFAQALRRSWLKANASFLFHWDSFRGADYKDKESWLVARSKTARIKRSESLTTRVVVTRNNLLIRYKAFHALEEFLQLDHGKYKPKIIAKGDKDLGRGRHLVACFRIAASWIFLAAVFRAPLDLVPQYVKPAHGEPQVLWFIMGALVYLLNLLAVVVAGVVVLLGVFILCRPTHIEIGEKGLRFIGKTMPAILRDPILRWQDVVRIGVELPRGKASIADHWLVFYAKDGTRRRLRIGSIDTVAAREEILRAIERWAPSVPREVDVIKLLQAPCDYSYTELWLEALTAPPHRERLEPLRTGARLKNDHYVVSSLLGCGGQGTAYLAVDGVSSDNVVLKEFLLPVYVDVNVRRKALATFEQEARLLKELQHPQVVKLLDFFVEDHRAYLVLEHIDGLPLSVKVKEHGPLQDRIVLELTKQMCDILEYLSTREPPVVHRDFTPDNLILTRDGTLKLIDFNVAHQEATEGTTGTVVGKTPYMAPEQFRGAPVVASDMYSMGATIYFLLVGADPIPISCSDPIGAGANCSAKLSALVRGLTQPEVAARIKSTREVEELIARAKAELACSPEPVE